MPSWPTNLLYKRCLTLAKSILHDTRSKIIEMLWIALMEMESTGNKAEVVVENTDCIYLNNLKKKQTWGKKMKGLYTCLPVWMHQDLIRTSAGLFESRIGNNTS